MRGIITAAARSPRLLPITKHTPVSLLDVGGKPILGRQIEALHEAGVHDTLVITGFCADQIEAFCKSRASCAFNPFYDLSNVAMNLWLVRQELAPGFVLVYDDVLFQAELIKDLLATEKGIILVVDRKSVDREAEKVALKQGLVSAIGKDIDEPYGEFIGIAKFTEDTIPLLIEKLEQIARADLDTTFPKLIQQLIRHGHQVKVHATERPWRDIDFPDDLEEARQTWCNTP